MRISLFVAAAIGAGCILACAGQRPVRGPVDEVDVTFGAAPLAVGSKVRQVETHHGTFDVHASALGQSSSSSGTVDGREVRVEEVLASDAGATTKLRVSYLEHTGATKTEREDKRDPADPRVGKTYVVEAADPGPRVTDETGQPASPEETKLVQGDYRNLGTREPLFDELPARPLHPGEEIDQICGAVRLVADRHDVLLVECSVTFEGRRGDDGVFEVRVDVESHNKLASARIRLDGELLLRIADRQWTGFSGGGDIEIGARGSVLKVRGGGHVDITIRRDVGR